MKIGTIINLPNNYSHFGRIADEYGNQYSVDNSQIPENTELGEEFAYKVEIWGNDSGLAYDLKES